MQTKHFVLQTLTMKCEWWESRGPYPAFLQRHMPWNSRRERRWVAQEDRGYWSQQNTCSSEPEATSLFTTHLCSCWWGEWASMRHNSTKQPVRLKSYKRELDKTESTYLKFHTHTETKLRPKLIYPLGRNNGSHEHILSRREKGERERERERTEICTK